MKEHYFPTIVGTIFTSPLWTSDIFHTFVLAIAGAITSFLTSLLMKKINDKFELYKPKTSEPKSKKNDKK
ncbi:MAG: hypothetical protein Q8O88_03545 [bacterium]|nr:hypothetical protein [bacterium]